MTGYDTTIVSQTFMQVDIEYDERTETFGKYQEDFSINTWPYCKDYHILESSSDIEGNKIFATELIADNDGNIFYDGGFVAKFDDAGLSYIAVSENDLSGL